MMSHEDVADGGGVGDDVPVSPDSRGVVCIANRGFSSNTYLVPGAEPGRCVVIDPGLDTALLDRTLDACALEPVAAVSTHGHFDHIGSVEHLRRRHGIPHYLHQSDLKIARQANFLMTMCRIPGRVIVPHTDVPFTGETTVTLAGREFHLLPVPGHTPGSCFVLCGRTDGGDAMAFTGDTLYRRGQDVLGLPGSDHGRMRESLRALWDTLAEDTWIYPGHGGSAPFGDIRRNNIKLRAFLGLDEQDGG